MANRNGKVALVTGANKGLGKESARQCLADTGACDASEQTFKEIMASSLRLAGCLRSSKTDDALCDEVPFSANAVEQALWSAGVRRCYGGSSAGAARSRPRVAASR